MIKSVVGNISLALGLGAKEFGNEADARVRNARLRVLGGVVAVASAVTLGQFVIGSVILTCKIGLLAGTVYLVARPFLSKERQEMGDKVVTTVQNTVLDAVQGGQNGVNHKKTPLDVSFTSWLNDDQKEYTVDEQDHVYLGGKLQAGTWII